MAPRVGLLAGLVMSTSCVLDGDAADVDVVGTYSLDRVGSACDVWLAGAQEKTGGTFTADESSGDMELKSDGTMHHHFRMRGQCSFPDGRVERIDGTFEGIGTYEVKGSDVEMVHRGVACVGRYAADTLTVRTGTLISSTRLTYSLRRQSTL